MLLKAGQENISLAFGFMYLIMDVCIGKKLATMSCWCLKHEAVNAKRANVGKTITHTFSRL